MESKIDCPAQTPFPSRGALNEIRGGNTIRSLASKTKKVIDEKDGSWEEVSIRSYLNKLPSFAVNVQEDGSCEKIINLSNVVKDLLAEK
jgi:hypothetical protein